MRLIFSDCEMDLDRYELCRGGRTVPVEPQVFDVLAYLVRHHDVVVTKEQLLDEIWGDRFVSESALTSRIKAARAAVGDDGRNQRLIKTIHGRGYRFVGAVTKSESQPAVAARHNLPSDRTPLFGRREEIDLVGELLEQHRLITLLGIGGTGKTRLAVSAGREVSSRFTDGVWFVDLVPVADSRSVVTAMADAAGLALADGAEPTELAAMVTDRNMLFVLDNCEHIIDHVVDVVDAIIDHTERPRFLLTSREPLGLPDERRIPLDPLALDGEPELSPAVQLFMASAGRFGVDLTDEHVSAVLQICVHLDGLPLAIELAAAQLRQLSIADLTERLDKRFELLSSGGRGQLRHASLNSVLVDTWAMLDEDEQLLLCQLAAFPGRFDVASVEQVTADLDVGTPALTLAGLVDRSLITHDADRPDGHDLLETVRLFGRLRTEHGTAEQFATRHSEWCLKRVGRDPAEHFYSWDLAQWCSNHHDDLRAAERHLTTVGRHADAAELLTGTALATHMDPGTRASACLARIDEYLGMVDEPELVARLHLTAVVAGMATRSRDRIERHGSAALALTEPAESAINRALALVFASWTTVFVDAERAIEMVEDAEKIAVTAGHEATADCARAYRGSHLVHTGRLEEAIPMLWEVVDRREDSVDYGTYTARNTLISGLVLTDPEAARALEKRFEGRPSVEQQSWTHSVLGAAVEAAVGNIEESVSLLDEVRAHLARACNDDGLPDVLLPAAVAAHLGGDDELCSTWLTAIRRADRPTQSFQATALFRQLRARVGLSDEDPLEEQSLAEIDRSARDWMKGQI